MAKKKRLFIRFGHLMITILIGLMMLPVLLNIGVIGLHLVQRSTGPSTLAPMFTPTIHYWSGALEEWASEHQIDVNLMATVMQIESCGHPSVTSPAGAQGLFQVMPFHFAEGEDYLDPDTNAYRAANFLHECSRFANDDVGLTLACYNGGPSVTRRSYETWPAETQRYYVWGISIYNDAQYHYADSAAITSWLDAGGRHLCRRAREVLP